MIIKIVFFFLCFAVSIQAQNATDTLRVLTFNIYGAPDSDWPTRISLILDELDTLQADIICLQEIVETPGLQSADNRARILADSLFERTGIGYNYIWQPTHFSWGVFDEGIAIISPHIILENDFIDLPPGLFTRKAIWASVLTPAGIINVYNTHLSYGNQEPVRIEQVAVLQNFIHQKSAAYPAKADILCGDFNATPFEPPMQFLRATDTSSANFLDSWFVINPADSGFTMPAENPTERIDYVIIKDNEATEILDSRLAFINPNQADIFPSDHIGVLSAFKTSGPFLNIDLQNPSENSEVSGNTEISWTIGNQTEELTYKIFISNDAGKSWQSLWEGEAGSNAYIWNTLQNPDGANYLLRIAAIGDSSFGLAEVTGTFSVNNPGNAAPELRIINPRGYENIQGIFDINWEAKDADSDILDITIQYTLNDGLYWQNIAAHIENSGYYEWNTRLFSNSSKYKLKIICADGSLSVNKTTDAFSIINERVDLPASNIQHVQGSGSGTVAASSFDAELLTGHNYTITFNDSIPDLKTYSVFNNTTSQLMVENATEMDGLTEGPAFDGIRLLIFDYSNARIDNANSGWQLSNTNLAYSISLPTLFFAEEIIYGFPSAADYKITLTEQVVDTSSTFLNAAPVPMKFYVENITENYQVDILYLENDADNSISPLDRIYILEKDDNDLPIITWQLFFPNNPNPILPVAGDEFVVSTLKPFTPEDVFEFQASISGLEKTKSTGIFQFQLEQNYPNPFNPATRITFTIPVSTHVELAIYNIAGQRVKRLLNKSLAAGVHTAYWNAAELASGLYFYKINAGTFSAVKKALLLK